MTEIYVLLLNGNLDGKGVWFTPYEAWVAFCDDFFQIATDYIDEHDAWPFLKSCFKDFEKTGCCYVTLWDGENFDKGVSLELKRFVPQEKTEKNW